MHQAIAASVEEDQRALSYLMDSRKCFPLESELEVTVLDSGRAGWVKIRIYRKAGTLEVFTVREAVKKWKAKTELFERRREDGSTYVPR